MHEADTLKQDLWRLGMLLSGSQEGADRALHRVLTSSENVLKLGAERRLRLVVAGAREVEKALATRPQGHAERVRDVLAGLELLPRVCWVLRDVQGMDEVAAARAVGVSKSAVETYAQKGREAVRASLGDGMFDAIDALRRAGEGAGAEAGVARVEGSMRKLRARRRLLRAATLLVFFGVLGLLAWIGSDLLRTHERELEQLNIVEDVSVPMSPDDAARREELQRQREGKPAGRELPRRDGP